MTKHFICTGGCNGVSNMPGVCNAKDCPKHGQPLMECKCEDGKHEGALSKCENCGHRVSPGSKMCADGKCALDTFKPELPA
ncbi:MAG: hypothetical protein V4439_03230 [Patescibacteria group bacterium]